MKYFIPFKKLRRFISPFFIARYYIIRDLQFIINKYKFKGELIDIGCGNKPYKSLFNNIDYKGIDFHNCSKNKDFEDETPDFFFNKNYLRTFKLPFKNNSYDVVTSFQVLEHHKKPQLLLDEIYRITKKNGYIILTVPFIWPLHEVPNDYYRFTKYGLIDLFKKYECEVINITKQGSFFSTIYILVSYFLNNFAARNKFNFFISILFYLPFLFLQYMSFIFDKFVKSDEIFFNYLVLLKKNNN